MINSPISYQYYQSFKAKKLYVRQNYYIRFGAFYCFFNEIVCCVFTTYKIILFQLFMKTVSTRKEGNQQKKIPNHLCETLNDFVIGNNTKMSVMENETSDKQNKGQHIEFWRSVDSESQKRVNKNNIDDKVKRVVDDGVLTVKNCMQDAILTAMDKVVFPKIETAMKSITASSGRKPNSEVLYPDKRDFLGNAGNTPLMSACSRLELNTNLNRNLKRGTLWNLKNTI